MNDLKMEIDMEIEILEYSGEGYNKTMNFEAWRVAIMNYAERFDESNFIQMERHHLTDEVFVLLYGKATLVVGENMQKYEMDTGKLYNVKKGVWHHIFLSKDAKVLIVENHNTGFENTEYINVILKI